MVGLGIWPISLCCGSPCPATLVLRTFLSCRNELSCCTDSGMKSATRYLTMHHDRIKITDRPDSMRHATVIALTLLQFLKISVGGANVKKVMRLFQFSLDDVKLNLTDKPIDQVLKCFFSL